jgi:translation initiation factor 1
MSIANDTIDNVDVEVGKPDNIETTAAEANDTKVADSVDSADTKQPKKPKAADDETVIPSNTGDAEFSRPGVFDPFAEVDEELEEKAARSLIHIRIQQRNGRKTLTTVQGLPKKFDQRKILKVIKKKFACNGTTVFDRELGEVIQLQGDQRKLVRDFLIDEDDGLELDERDIKIHGF